MGKWGEGRWTGRRRRYWRGSNFQIPPCVRRSFSTAVPNLGVRSPPPLPIPQLVYLPLPTGKLPPPLVPPTALFSFGLWRGLTTVAWRGAGAWRWGFPFPVRNIGLGDGPADPLGVLSSKREGALYPLFHPPSSSEHPEGWPPLIKG